MPISRNRQYFAKRFVIISQKLSSTQNHCLTPLYFETNYVWRCSSISVSFAQVHLKKLVRKGKMVHKDFLESIEYNNRSTMPAGWCIWSSDVAVHMFLGIASPKMQKTFLYVNVAGTADFDTRQHTVANLIF